MKKAFWLFIAVLAIFSAYVLLFRPDYIVGGINSDYTFDEWDTYQLNQEFASR